MKFYCLLATFFLSAAPGATGRSELPPNPVLRRLIVDGIYLGRVRDAGTCHIAYARTERSLLVAWELDERFAILVFIPTSQEECERRRKKRQRH